jgi:hypothetical protein
MSDQGLIIDGSGSGHREFRFGRRRAGCFDGECRLQCFNVVRNCAGRESMQQIKSQISVAAFLKNENPSKYPAAPVGRYEPSSSNRFSSSKLRGQDRQHTVARRRPDEAALLQPFGDEGTGIMAAPTRRARVAASWT